MERQVTEHSVCEAELKVTEYSMCGIFLVPYAMVRKTWQRRAAGPRVKATLVVLLFNGGGSKYWELFCFLRYYQAVTNQLCYDSDPDIRHT